MSVLRICHDGTEEAEGLLARLRDRAAGASAEVEDRVREILSDVRARGDEAIGDWTERLDGARIDAGRLEVPPGEWGEALARLDREDREALELAARRIETYHQEQRLDSWEIRDGGARLGQVVRPLRRVGIYVPGGTAAYPSTVLMNAIPARVAGVRDIAAVTPARGGSVPGAILAACHLAGVTRLYRVGGAQAVGALAFGTATIAAVDKIVGPGNIYVATAKRQVYAAQAVDIDRFAGPSEVLILADDTADAEFVALDLLAQAEHDREASALLVTTSEALAEAVALAVDRELASLPRREVATESLARYGGAVVVTTRERAFAVADGLAPEHLGVHMREPRAAVDAVRAGAIFLGGHSPEAIGDYVAGPNHVLPTAGAARYGSPLGVYDFVNRSSVIELGAADLRRLGPSAVRLARLEGLEAHARSVTRRIEAPGEG